MYLIIQDVFYFDSVIRGYYHHQISVTNLHTFTYYILHTFTYEPSRTYVYIGSNLLLDRYIYEL